MQMLPASSRSSIAFAWVLIVRIVFSKFATFTDESAVNWNPFKVDEDCPRFVIANVGVVYLLVLINVCDFYEWVMCYVYNVI